MLEAVFKSTIYAIKSIPRKLITYSQSVFDTSQPDNCLFMQRHHSAPFLSDILRVTLLIPEQSESMKTPHAFIRDLSHFILFRADFLDEVCFRRGLTNGANIAPLYQCFQQNTCEKTLFVSRWFNQM